MTLLGEVGCYVLDLYCNQCQVEHVLIDTSKQFTGHTLAQARKAARKAGWVTGRKKVLCPGHNPSNRDT